MTANQNPGSHGSRITGITRFGVFQFHWEADSLRRDGKDLSIQPQPLALLKLFLRRPGEMITREEIHNALWQGRVVELDQSLNFCMRKLRDPGPVNTPRVRWPP